MFSHAPSVTGWVGGRSLNGTAQLSSALDDFPTVSRPGRSCFHPQKHSSLPQPTAGSVSRNPSQLRFGEKESGVSLL